MYRDHDQRNFARKLRNGMTEAEKRLWRLLRANQLGGHKFRRQAAIGPYIVDFVCFAQKLVVELDGPQHVEPQNVEHDARRTDWLIDHGFRLIRFRNQQLDENFHAVADVIASALAEIERCSPESPLPNPPRQEDYVNASRFGWEVLIQRSALRISLA